MKVEFKDGRASVSVEQEGVQVWHNYSENTPIFNIISDHKEDGIITNQTIRDFYAFWKMVASPDRVQIKDTFYEMFQ